MRFDSYHPFINFLFFTAVILMAILFDHPVFIMIAYVSSFIYSVKLRGKKALILNLALIAFIVLWPYWYSYYTHFGVTVISLTFIGNSVTLESLMYGFAIAFMIVSVVMWLSCVMAIISSDKVVYLFGRVSPHLSLFLSVILRMGPRISNKAKKISESQRFIGKGIKNGNIFIRILNFFRIGSVVVTWTLENFVEVSDSMKNRGVTLKGRTAFSIYRFDNRDRGFVIALFVCVFVVYMGFLLDQTNILYDPEIVINKITPLSFVFYTAYAVMCLMPMILQIAGEYDFDKKIKNNKWEKQS